MTIWISKYNFAILYKRATTASRHILVSIEHTSLPYFYDSYIPYLLLSVPYSPAGGHPADIHINTKPFDFGQTINLAVTPHTSLPFLLVLVALLIYFGG